MGQQIISDKSGEALDLKDAASYRAVLTLSIDPTGHQAMKLETPTLWTKKVSRNMVDNPDYQEFLADLAIVTSAIESKWTEFWSTYKARLDNQEL